MKINLYANRKFCLRKSSNEVLFLHKNIHTFSLRKTTASVYLIQLFASIPTGEQISMKNIQETANNQSKPIDWISNTYRSRNR